MIATFWQQMPFIRLLIPFIIGISVGDYLLLNRTECLFLLAFSVILNFSSYHFVKSFRFEPIHGLQHTFLCFILGIFVISHEKSEILKNHFSTHKTNWLLVQTETKGKQTNKRISFETIVIAGQNQNSTYIPLQGKLQLSLPKDSLSLKLAQGDQILIKSQYQEISLPKNPGEFNYKAFMARKGIFHQQQLILPEWKLYASSTSFSLLKKVGIWQDAISFILAKHLGSEAEIGISEALLFGLDDHIPDELIQAYSKTGTLHVLAVSGMHVGLIFLILGWLSKPFKRKKWGRNVEPYFLLLGIWAYALLCGLSPSILRATIMFSFMTIGKLIHRNGNAYNSLAASAFFLLCIQPQMLWHAGFQLSYAAVLGIISFYPSLYQLWYIGNKFLNEVWKVIAVSLAAQVFTFPISLYYFHQFPNYFLVANLLLIPITTLLIYLGIILVLVHKIGFLASAIAWLVSKGIALANFMVVGLANLPYSAIENIHFPLSKTLFTYYLITLIAGYLFNKNAHVLRLLLLSIIVGFGLNQMLNIGIKNQAQLTIYALPKKTMISIVSKKQGMVWSAADSTKTLKIIQQHFVQENIRLRPWIALDSGSFVLAKQNFPSILVLNHAIQKWPKKIDLLIVGHKKHRLSDSLLIRHKIKQVVLLQGLSAYHRKEIQKLCGKHKLPCHDIAQQGAFTLKEEIWKHW